MKKKFLLFSKQEVFKERSDLTNLSLPNVNTWLKKISIAKKNRFHKVGV